MTTFVLVHGIMHGGWCWQPVTDRLTAAGHTVHAIDLPLVDQVGDAAVVTELLDSITGPKVLAGHSYGGLVISRAAKGRTDLSRLVYVAAVMVPSDANYLDVAAESPSTTLGDAIEVSDDGFIELADAHAAAEAFYGACEPTVANDAVPRLRRTGVLCIATPPENEPWPEIPTSYVLCTQDKAILPELQRQMSAHADQVFEIETDHSPFMSTPHRLAEILGGS